MRPYQVKPISYGKGGPGPIMAVDDRELQKIIEKKSMEIMSKHKQEPRPLVVTLSRDDFDEYIYVNIPVVVDFWAEWCGPCRIMHPIFEMAAKRLRGLARFGRLNVDEYPDIAGRYSVFSIPTFIIFKNGVELNRLVGSVSQQEFIEFITSNV